MMNREENQILQLLYMGAVGAFALTAQTILLRELMVVAWGNELVFGTGLGCWLLGIYWGAVVGTGLCRRRPGLGRPMLIGAGAVLVLLNLGVLFFIRLIKGIVHIPTGQMPGYGITFLGAGIAFAIAAFPVGFTFPLMVRRLVEKQHVPGHRAGTSVYIAEGAGAFCMALVLAVLFKNHVRGEVCILVAACPVLLLALMDTRRGRPCLRFAVLASIVLALLLVRIGGPRSVQQRWRQLTVGQLISEVETPYQLLQEGKLDNQTQIAANGKMVLSFPDMVTARLKVLRLVTQHPEVTRVLVAGPVTPDEANEWQAWGNVKVISIVLDPALHGLTADTGDGVQRIHGDLRDRLIRERLLSGGSFEIVVLDATAPAGSLVNRYLTEKFMMELCEVLAPDGVLAVSMPPLVNYGTGHYGSLAGILVRTVGTVFPYRSFSAASPHWLFACRTSDITTEEPDVIGDRLRVRIADWNRISRYLAMGLDSARLTLIRNAEKRSEVDLNTDERPVLALAYGKLSGWYSGSGSRQILDWLGGMPFLLGILPLLILVIRVLPVDRSGTMVPVGALGFSAMSMEMVVIYVLQLIGGSVYSRVAMLTGCFMLGLPLGAALMRRLVSALGRPIRLPLLGALLLYVVFLWVWRSGHVVPALLYPFNLILGLVIGAMFPAAMRTLQEVEAGVAVRAGRIDAADHLGAASGAVFAGGAGLLILGVSGTVLLAMAVLGASLLPVFRKDR